MTKANDDKKDKKRPYHKPQVEQVELVPEEAVLGGCKTTIDAGPDGAICGTSALDQCEDLLFS